MPEELEQRFHNFGKNVSDFCSKLKYDIINAEYIKQVFKSSGSVGANYIEASDDLGKVDEKMKLKISRRKAKESRHWLDLILIRDNKNLKQDRFSLMDEAMQIKNSFIDNKHKLR